MKIARRWWQFQAVGPKEEVADPVLFERVLKVERELHSLVLELADLTDFTHRMAKRRYTENYDAVVPRSPTKAPGVSRPGGVANMSRDEKVELLRKVRGA